MSAPTLQVTRLAKAYGQRFAVRDLSFTASAGDVVGFVGPNGAGKTTTIRILSTVLRATSGEFAVAGVPGTDPTRIRRRIGVLPESAGYPTGRTGREYLRHFGRLYGLDRAAADRRARSLLAEFGLAEPADRAIATYSRGMRQRLGIARTVVNDPAVVFLDEPTLGLDPAGQRQVLAIVRGLAQDRGVTVLLSTHALAVVEELCSSVLVLDQGRVLAAGSVAEVSRGVGLRRSVRLRVPAWQVDRALAALTDLADRTDRTEPAALEVDGDASGLLTVTRVAAPGSPPDPGTDAGTQLLRAVLDAGVQVLSFDADDGRLSDAFASITAGGPR
jgi:ABC-2 type transport system ATP-binding protein